MKIGAVYNKYINNTQEIIHILETGLKSCNAEYTISDSENLSKDVDFVFAIGGDGTILNVAKFYAALGIPVMGVNIGRLGFLSQTDLYMFSLILKDVTEGKYKIEERIGLECNGYTALNDFVIKSCQSTRAAKFELEINGAAVCEYISDGLIISTPTGSTAYCLSAGGPILAPTVEAFTIVPICPHTLTARPLVIPDNETLTVRSNDCPLSVAADGSDLKINSNTVTIKKSECKIKLAFLNDNNFYNVLREKLFWGIAPASQIGEKH